MQYYTINFRYNLHTNNGIEQHTDTTMANGDFNDMWEATKAKLEEIVRRDERYDSKEIGDIETEIKFGITGTDMPPMRPDLYPELVKIRKKLRGERNESSRQS